jgi:hypothetical protein
MTAENFNFFVNIPCFVELLFYRICIDEWKLVLASGLFEISRFGWPAVLKGCTPLNYEMALGLINLLSALSSSRFWWVDDKTMQVNDLTLLPVCDTVYRAGIVDRSNSQLSALCRALSAHSVYHTQVRIAVRPFGDWFINDILPVVTEYWRRYRQTEIHGAVISHPALYFGVNPFRIY